MMARLLKCVMTDSLHIDAPRTRKRANRRVPGSCLSLSVTTREREVMEYANAGISTPCPVLPSRH